jgi:hypothetical protein
VTVSDGDSRRVVVANDGRGRQRERRLSAQADLSGRAGASPLLVALTDRLKCRQHNLKSDLGRLSVGEALE